MNFQKLFSKKFNNPDKENQKEHGNLPNNDHQANGKSLARNITTPLFESPPVEKVAKSYTGYHTVSVKNIGQSAGEGYDDVQQVTNQQQHQENLQRQLAQRLAEESLLCNYLNNIAEFSKLNDIDALDDFQPQVHDGQTGPVSSQMNDNFIKCLLTSLEFLAHKWELIDQKKYKYRFSKQNQSCRLVFEQQPDGRAPIPIGIPKDTYVQAYFSVGTMKLALSRVYMKTFDSKEILVEKEYALASAKLVQQFQKLLHFIKQKVEPVFFPEEQEMAKNKPAKKVGFGQKLKTLFQNIVSFGDDQDEVQKEKNKQNLVRNQALIKELKQELKNFERMIRVFEMTYLDMIERLQEMAKEKNLKSGPKEVQQEFKINQKGQVIQHEQQYFDKDANLIDRDAKTIKHQITRGNNANGRVGRTKQVISLVGNKQRNDQKSGSRDGSGFNLSLSPATRVVVECDSFQQSSQLNSMQRMKDKGVLNTSNYMAKSEKTLQTNSSHLHNDSTNYASSGIGNQFKESTFNVGSVQNSNFNGSSNRGNILSTEGVCRKKTRVSDLKQDKENGYGGRRSMGTAKQDKENKGRISIGTIKQSSEKSSKKLFQNSLPKLNEQQSCIFEQESEDRLNEKASSNTKANSSNLIMLDKDDQQIYYPYTTKNKLYNNAGKKIVLNAIQNDYDQPNNELIDGKQLVDLASSSQVNTNVRSHRVNLFESKIQPVTQSPSAVFQNSKQKEIEIEEVDGDAENCDVNSQGEEVSSNLMEEYKLFGNDKRDLVKMTNTRPPLHTKDYNAPSNHKSNQNLLTRSTGLSSAMSPNSNKASVKRVSAIARSLELKQHQIQTGYKQALNNGRLSGGFQEPNLPPQTFMSQNKRFGLSNEESDLFTNANCNIESQNKQTFTSNQFDVSSNIDKEDDQVKY